MFKSFSRSITILRHSDGWYNDSGNYVDGSINEITIQASVQRLKMQALSALNVSIDGNYFVNYIKIYSAEELIPSANHSNGDMLIWNGRKYRVIYSSPSFGRVIEHYKSIAVEVIDD